MEGSSLSLTNDLFWINEWQESGHCRDQSAFSWGYCQLWPHPYICLWLENPNTYIQSSIWYLEMAGVLATWVQNMKPLSRVCCQTEMLCVKPMSLPWGMFQKTNSAWAKTSSYSWGVHISCRNWGLRVFLKPQQWSPSVDPGIWTNERSITDKLLLFHAASPLLASFLSTSKVFFIFIYYLLYLFISCFSLPVQWRAGWRKTPFISEWAQKGRFDASSWKVAAYYQRASVPLVPSGWYQQSSDFHFFTCNIL